MINILKIISFNKYIYNFLKLIFIVLFVLGKFVSEHQNKFQTIVTFDCRGIEPVDFSPGVGWIAKVEGSNNKYRDIDLSQKEWVEYDTNIKESVGIYDFEHKFVKVK